MPVTKAPFQSRSRSSRSATSTPPPKRPVPAKTTAKTSPTLTTEEKARRSANYRAFVNRDNRPPNAGTKELPEGAPNCLAGKSFLITGVLDSLERAECEALILKHGGKVAKSVTKALTYAVIGTEPGASKMKSLDERPDVKRLDEDGLFELIRSAAISPEQAKKIAADKEKPPPRSRKSLRPRAARMAAQMGRHQHPLPLPSLQSRSSRSIRCRRRLSQLSAPPKRPHVAS
jgi:replication factor C subunit 1